MLGTGYRPDRGGDPRGHPTVGMDEIEALVAAFDAALPGVDLHPSEVTRIHVGALPAVEASRGLRLLDRIGPRHRSDPDPVNLVSFLTTKYTTARRAAVRGVDACERRLGRTPSSPRSDGVGRCRLRQARRGPGPGDELTTEFVERAVSEEMALRLGDLLLRRTNLGAAGPPAPAVVDLAVETMGDLLAWDRPRRREERRALAAEYHPLVRPDDVGEVRTGREGRPAREADRPEEP